MTVDALFPARAVIEPFFGDRIFPAPSQPGWAEGRPIELEALALADPVLQIMSLAGWRASRVNYTYLISPQTFPEIEWVSINLHTRISENVVMQGGGSMIDGSARLWIDFEQMSDGGSNNHAYTDIPAFDPDTSPEWEVEILPSGTLRLFFQTRHDPSRPMPADAAAYQAHFNARMAELSIQIHNFATATSAALKDAFTQVISQVGAAGLTSHNTPGLIWLFNPNTWINSANTRFNNDLFVVAVSDAASEVWAYFRDRDELPELVEKRFTPLAKLHEVAEVTARNSAYVADQGEVYGPELFPEYGPPLPPPALAAAPDGPFQGLAESVSFFNLICAMIHLQRIIPPDLGNLGLTGNFEEDFEEGAAEDGPLVVMFGHMTENDTSSEEYCALFVFGVFAYQLIQSQHPHDASFTPKLRDRVGWEYKGIQPDGAHLIALTLGRGVRIIEVNHGMNLRLDVFRAQSQSDFRRPLPRPAYLDPVEVPQADLDAFYLPPDHGDDYSVNPPFMTDDLSATAAQSLDHQMLRGVRVFEAYIPNRLTNIPISIPGVDPVLANFSTQSPPVLAVRMLDRGGMRFEWYRDGLVREAPAQPEITYAINIRPNVPENSDPGDRSVRVTDASFGVSWFLDYACLLHKPISEDGLAKVIAANMQDALSNMLSTKTAGLTNWVTEGTWLDGDQVAQEIADWVRPHGVGFFRLWYSGDDVRIEVERFSDSDESFRVEIVKVENVLDLPEQGTRLPARSTYMGDYVHVGSPPTDSAHVGALSVVPCYDFMLDPDASDIPLWTAANMPASLQLPGGGYRADALSHVAALETYAENFIAGWMGGVVSYSDGKYFVINDDDWASWSQWFSNNSWPEPDNRIPGTLRTEATTEWMLFTIWVDVIVGFIPYLGTSVDVAEFLYAFETGEDKWGEPVATWQLILMGIAASVPFVSGSALKGVTSSVRRLPVTDSFLGSVLPSAMRGGPAGMSEKDLLGLLRLWEPTGKTLDEKAVTEVATELVETSLKNSHDTATRLNPKEIIDALAEMTVDVIEGPARAAAGIAVRSLDDADCSFILTMKSGAIVQVRIPALEEAFKQAVASANKNGKTLTWSAFIQSQKYARGMNRAIADVFGLIQYSKAVRNTGVPKGGGMWTLMGDLALNAPKRLAPAAMLDRLKQPNVVSNIRQSLMDAGGPTGQNAEAIAYLNQYGDDVQRLITDLEAQGMLTKLIGSKEYSDEYVVVGLARVLEYFDDALMTAGHPSRVTDLFSEADTAAMTATELSQRATLLEAIADFGGMAIRQVRFPWAYELELDAAVILTKKTQAGVIEFTTQVAYAGRKGADGAGFVEEGFGVIEAKALAKAVEQIGAEGVQPNMLQAMKSVLRMAEVLAGGAAGPLDDVIVPAFSQNRFLRRFFFLADRAHLARSGQMSLEALYEFAGGVVSIPISRIPDPGILAQVKLLGRQIGDDTNGVIDIIEVDKWYRAAQLLDQDALDVVFKQAADAQASEIRDMLLAMNSQSALQALLEGQGTLGPRTSANLAALVNSRKSWPGLPIHSQNLSASYFTERGAARFFEIIGEADEWLNPVLKLDPTNPNEAVDVAVSILSRADLDALPANAFSLLPARSP